MRLDRFGDLCCAVGKLFRVGADRRHLPKNVHVAHTEPEPLDLGGKHRTRLGFSSFNVGG